MGQVIVSANQKGGVGKTTTAVNLAASLAEADTRTLLFDMDPQANACSGLGVDKSSQELTVYNALLGEVPAREVVVKTSLAQLDILPSNTDLIGADTELVTPLAREATLPALISDLKSD